MESFAHLGAKRAPSGARPLDPSSISAVDTQSQDKRDRGMRLFLFGGAILSVLSMPDRAMAAESEEELDDTIVVTAFRRNEALISAPAAISAVPGDEFTSVQQLNPLETLVRASPNAAFQDTGSFAQSRFLLRGVGPLSVPINTVDSSVAYSVAGVPTSATGLGGQLFDLTRVEVIRGAQGTLFGRPSLAGAIDIVPTPADGTKAFRANVEAGEHGYLIADAAAGGWLSEDRLAVRAAVRMARFGGDIPDVTRGGTSGGARATGGRLTLRWTASSGTDAVLMGYIDRERREGPRFLSRSAEVFPASALDIAPRDERDQSSLALTVRHDLARAILTGVASAQWLKTRLIQDDTDALVFSGAFGRFGPPFSDPGFWNNTTVDKSAFVQDEQLSTYELRLNAAPGGLFEWVIGANAIRSKLDVDRNGVSTFFPTLNGRYDTKLTSWSLGAFADGTLRFGTSPFALSAGLRFSHDRQEFDTSYRSNNAPGTVAAYEQNGQFRSSGLTGRLAISYDMGERGALYISGARGRSPGGFPRFTDNAAIGRDTPVFGSAGSWTVESGAKLSLVERRLQLLFALFHNEVDDQAFGVFDGATSIFSFTSLDYNTRGFEAEASLRASDMLRFKASVGYTHAEIDGPGGGRVPLVPRWTGRLAADARIPARSAGGGFWLASIDAAFAGRRPADVDNSFELRAYELVNFRLGWERGPLSFSLFADNLLDQRNELSGARLGPVETVTVGRGRVLGAGARVGF
jgi:iron complex outermembrane receptor protein